MAEPYRLDATWTDDAQGKKDYDGPILTISTRYWPRGGGFLVVNRTPTRITIEDDTHRRDIKPSAKSSLCLCIAGYPESVTLTSQSFEGETFEEVAHQVETWAQATMDHVVAVLRQAFPAPWKE